MFVRSEPICYLFIPYDIVYFLILIHFVVFILLPHLVSIVSFGVFSGPASVLDTTTSTTLEMTDVYSLSFKNLIAN